MKKIIFLTLVIIVLYYLLSINNYQEFSEVMDEQVMSPDQVFIREEFNAKSSEVKIKEEEFNELMGLISETKYRKVVPYSPESFTIRYQMISNDGDKKLYLIVDASGIVLQSEGNRLKRYIIREEEVNIILNYLEAIVDRNDTVEGNLTKSDSDYINNNIAQDISIAELLRKTNIDLKDIIIGSIDLSVSGDGYINSINMTFFNEHNTEKSILVYDKLESSLKINKFESQSNDVLKETNNLIILNALDYLLKEPNELKDYRSKRLISLHNPYKISMSNQNKVLYYNGKSIKNKERSGIVFSTIDINSSKDSDFIFHIFDENLDLQQ